MRKSIALVAATLALAGGAFADPPASPASAPALLPAERGWLSKLESDAYDQKVKTDAAAAVADARTGIAQNLPADVRGKYKKLTAPPIDAIRLNTFLSNVVGLTPNEVAYFESKNPAALKAYQAKMAALQDPDHSIPLNKRDDAHKIVLHYRAITQGSRPGTPGHKPGGTPAPAGGAAVPLTARETAWLTETETTGYAAALKKTPLPKSERLQILKKYRDALAGTDLPAEFRDGYKAKLAEGPNAEKIDAFLLTIVELSGDELAALEKIIKGKEPAGFTLTQADARKEYDGETAALAKEGGHPVPKETRRAYAITAKYRDLLKKAGVAPAPTPTTPTAGGPTSAPTGAQSLSDKELAALTPEQKAAYQQEIAAAKGDASKIADVVQKYRRLAAKRDPDVFASLNPDEKKDLCAAFKAGAVQGSAADSRSSTELGGTGNAQSQLRQTADRVGAAQPTPTSAPTPSSAAADFSPQVKAACLAFLANASKPSGGPGNVTTTVPDPGSKPGTDKDPKPKDKKGFFDKMTKEQSANIRAGVAGAAVGLLIGSFFGPAGMLLGALIGGGALFGANYALNKMP